MVCVCVWTVVTVQLSFVNSEYNLYVIVYAVLIRIYDHHFCMSFSGIYICCMLTTKKRQYSLLGCLCFVKWNNYLTKRGVCIYEFIIFVKFIVREQNVSSLLSLGSLKYYM